MTTTDEHRAAALRPMPATHGDITTEWLTAALRSGGVDATVSGFERKPLGEGVGMMAALERIELTYSEGDGPASIIVKLPATNEANKAVALAFDIYRREVLFYRELADHTDAGTPVIHVAEVDGSEDFVLILEDMAHYRLGDQLAGCSIPDARSAVAEIAELHAAFWDAVDDASFDFVPHETPSVHGNALREGSLAGWDPMCAAFGDTVPEHMRAVKDRFLAAVPNMQQWLVTSPITIVHGDFRMDNIFFSDADGAVSIIDWQGCLRSKGIRDVAYLLSQSMLIEDRRSSEHELVALWHQTLVDRGVTGYSAEQAWEDYRRAVLCLWTLVVVIAGTLDTSNERGKAWMTEMVRRSAAAIEDLDLLTLLPEFE
jgi:aminoglycoside phosphotransferase (APT) family kinase protein